MNPRLMTLLFLVNFLSPELSWAADPRTVYQNNEGAKLLEEAAEELQESQNQEEGDSTGAASQKAYKAYAELLKGLKHGAFDPEIRMNLGLAFELSEETDKALKEYSAAVRMSQDQPELQFAALYNMARVQAQLKNIPAALESYQKALEIHPDSKEVKTNIELLWQGGQGNGKGDQNQEKKDNNGDGQGDDEKKEEPKGDGSEKIVNSRKQPRKFKSEELTQNDVRKILEEIKNQEQKIRAKMFEGQVKEKNDGKDW